MKLFIEWFKLALSIRAREVGERGYSTASPRDLLVFLAEHGCLKGIERRRL